MRALFSLLVLSLITLPAAAQNVRVLADDEACDRSGWGDRNTERYCEVREITLPANRDLIRVDGGKNGGIRVEGWNRKEMLIRAIVTATDRTEDAARERVDEIDIKTNGTIEADLPENRSRGKYWTSVSFEIFVPRTSNLSLDASNGGIHIANIDGDVRFETTNGGVKLIDLAGDIRGHTTNGGVDIELTGSAWKGEALDVETTNGGVEIRVPEDYSARLEAGTTNGGIRFDFPVMVQGQLNKRISIDLGDGGNTVRAVTTNGGVRVRRS
ncbi:MAG: DUF4097 family beta strand repeat-containing protein [Rhodothermales bacterium]